MSKIFLSATRPFAQLNFPFRLHCREVGPCPRCPKGVLADSCPSRDLLTEGGPRPGRRSGRRRKHRERLTPLFLLDRSVGPDPVRVVPLMRQPRKFRDLLVSEGVAKDLQLIYTLDLWSRFPPTHLELGPEDRDLTTGRCVSAIGGRVFGPWFPRPSYSRGRSSTSGGAFEGRQGGCGTCHPDPRTDDTPRPLIGRVRDVVGSAVRGRGVRLSDPQRLFNFTGFLEGSLVFTWFISSLRRRKQWLMSSCSKRVQKRE